MDITTALGHHQRGEFQLAEQIYRQILQSNPNHPDALHLLGVIAMQVGRQQEAIKLIEQAIGQSPKNARFYSNLGAACRAASLQDRAVEAFQRAVELDPKHVQSLNNLAVILSDQGDHQQAEKTLRQALKIQPDYFDAMINLGLVLKDLGKNEEAISCYKKTIDLDPHCAEAHNNLGIIYKNQGNMQQAESLFQKAIQYKPQYPEALNNLSNLLVMQGNHGEAVVCLERSLALTSEPGTLNNYAHALRCLYRYSDAIEAYKKCLEIDAAPGENQQYLTDVHAEAYNGLATVYKTLGWLDDAEQQFQHALELKPHSAENHNNYGSLLIKLRQYTSAIKQFRQAIELDPQNNSAPSNIVYAMNLHPDLTVDEVFQEHLLQAKAIEASVHQFTNFTNARSADKTLKVAYLSPDFCEHVVARFISPILAHHDPQQVTTFCYANVEQPDATTEELQKLTQHWRNIRILNDQDLIEQLQHDEIDIVVDLAGHTANHRLRALAHRPAPIQVSYLGYPNTTGMNAIDYRLTDEIADPPANDRLHTETLIRLPHGFLCYQPPQDLPRPQQLPAINNGFVTFGSMNRFEKLNDTVLETWASLLLAVPQSRLMLKSLSIHNPSTRQFIVDYFDQQQIDQQRIIIHPYEKTTRGHMNVYHQIDIALDSFPYSGTTSTCDALWMGVPVITLAGQSHASRVSASLLNRVELDPLVASDQQQYISQAQQLAADLSRLQEIRSGLRSTMAQSDLCDGSKIARSIEEAYRQMWHHWCREKASTL